MVARTSHTWPRHRIFEVHYIYLNFRRIHRRSPSSISRHSNLSHFIGCAAAVDYYYYDGVLCILVRHALNQRFVLDRIVLLVSLTMPWRISICWEVNAIRFKLNRRYIFKDVCSLFDSRLLNVYAIFRKYPCVPAKLFFSVSMEHDFEHFNISIEFNWCNFSDSNSDMAAPIRQSSSKMAPFCDRKFNFWTTKT